MKKCNLWPHTDKIGGFQRGPVPPLWHTTLLARCSVLYLLARLTGETGGRCGLSPAYTGRKTDRSFVSGREKILFVFRERR